MAINRRQFLTLSSIVGAQSLSARRKLSSWLNPAKLSTLDRDPRRPQFHLLPARNWMNDPNGPIYHDGRYHMFFQYNPEAAVWGNMSWAHAISHDMVHWRNLPVAFTMTPDGPDAAGCFSGSTIEVEVAGHKRVYAIYTGVVRDKDHETIRNEGLRESQCLAWSDDPMLRQWHKASEPALPVPPQGLKVTGFRDPSVWREREHYLLTVGSGIERQGGCVLLFRSTDMLHWEYLHPLAQGQWTGQPTSNPCDDGEMWECPDFFALDGGHVLIYSTLGKVFWSSGVFDKQALRFEMRRTGVLDSDAFYAPKTQFDAQGRRIVWGWIPERRSPQDMSAAGWSGMLSLPRRLRLDREGELRMTFAAETSSLRGKAILVQTLGVGDQHTSVAEIPSACGEFQMRVSKDAPCSISLWEGDIEIFSARYFPEEYVLCIGQDRVSLGHSDIPLVHGFIDGSVVEVILGERKGLTKRFYYPENYAPAIRIHVVGEGAELQAWHAKPISSNRLTTL